MRDQEKTRRQLIDELAELHQRTTELEKAATERRRPEGKMECLVHSLAEGLLMFDEAGQLVVFNPAARRMLGCVEEGVDAQGLLQRLQESELASLLEKSLACDAGLRGVEVHVNGPQAMVLEFGTNPVREEAGNRIGTAVTLRDITRQKGLEDERDSFISTISRELRSPLFSITGFLDLIVNGKVPDAEKQKHFLAMAHDRSIHLSKLVEDLLDLSRMESGRLDMNMKALSMYTVIHRVAERLKNTATEKGIDLQVSLSTRLFAVHGNEDRLEQVVTNLVSSAIRFSGRGGKVLIKGHVKAKI